MLTVVVTPKGFSGRVGTAQRAALASLRALGPDVTIVLVGRGNGVREAAANVSGQWAPEVATGLEGLPMLADVIRIGRRHAGDGDLVYANADIAFTPDLQEALLRVPFRDYLLTGRRFEVSSVPPAFNSRDDLSEFVRTARLHPAGDFGIDYFALPARIPLDEHLPPFVVGRPGWDNWVLGWARRSGVASIDASDMVTALHLDASATAWTWDQPGSQSNKRLAADSLRLGLRDTTHRFRKGRVQRRLDPRDILRRLQLRFGPTAAAQ